GWSHQVIVSRYAIAVLVRYEFGAATIRAVPLRPQFGYRCTEFDRFFSSVGVSVSAGRPLIRGNPAMDIE
ncbi:hypothetical protein, partial [Bradyrhizobium ottawaense]|uniref:hypothetical protein n=1 Tax=Bradyrhizobium ottawaense TaxID=931866 RepID=UPI0030C736D8